MTVIALLAGASCWCARSWCTVRSCGVWGAALVASGLGDATWARYEAAGADPFPSIADAFYLAAYPALGFAILLLVRRYVPGGGRATMIDAGIVAVGTTALAWVLLGARYLDAGGSVPEISVALAHPTAPRRVSGDVTRVRQVLVNLLSNAVKFSEAGDVVVP